MESDDYLAGVLVDGAQPFRYRSRARVLLGVPDESGPELVPAPAPAGAGFASLNRSGVADRLWLHGVGQDLWGAGPQVRRKGRLDGSTPRASADSLDDRAGAQLVGPLAVPPPPGSVAPSPDIPVDHVVVPSRTAGPRTGGPEPATRTVSERRHPAAGPEEAAADSSADRTAPGKAQAWEAPAQGGHVTQAQAAPVAVPGRSPGADSGPRLPSWPSASRAVAASGPSAEGPLPSDSASRSAVTEPRPTSGCATPDERSDCSPGLPNGCADQGRNQRTDGEPPTRGGRSGGTGALGAVRGMHSDGQSDAQERRGDSAPVTVTTEGGNVAADRTTAERRHPMPGQVPDRVRSLPASDDAPSLLKVPDAAEQRALDGAERRAEDPQEPTDRALTVTLPEDDAVAPPTSPTVPGGDRTSPRCASGGPSGYGTVGEQVPGCPPHPFRVARPMWRAGRHEPTGFQGHGRPLPGRSTANEPLGRPGGPEPSVTALRSHPVPVFSSQDWNAVPGHPAPPLTGSEPTRLGFPTLPGLRRSPLMPAASVDIPRTPEREEASAEMWNEPAAAQAAPSVTVVRESAVAVAGDGSSAAFWERRHVSRLCLGTLR